MHGIMKISMTYVAYRQHGMAWQQEEIEGGGGGGSEVEVGWVRRRWGRGSVGEVGLTSPRSIIA